MIVDDEQDVLDSVVDVVENWGYDVVTERNGKRASLLYREYRPDIVLTDFNMPGCDGVESFNQIRKANPQAKVIFMSGFAENPKLKNIVSKSKVFLLKKPFPNEELEKILQMTAFK